MRPVTSTRPTTNARRFISLKKVLSLSVLALSVSVLVAVSGLEMVFIYRAQQQAVASEMALTAQRAADAVSREVAIKLNILAAAALSESADEHDSREAGVLGRLIGQYPSFSQVILWDVDGRERVRVCRGAEVDCRSSVSGLAPETADVLRSEPHYVGPVYLDAESNEPMVLIAVPVAGIFRGSQKILAAELRLKFMWDIISSVKVGVGGVAYVVDGEGNLIAFADASRVLKRENVSGLREVSEYVMGGKKPTATSLEPTRGIRGDKVVASLVELKNPDWAVIVEMPLAEAYAGVFRVAAQSGAAVAVGVIVSVLVGLYIARRVTRPVIELRRAAERMSEGDLTVNIGTKSRSEVGQLAHSFNVMAAKLRTSHGDLERKVQERTQSLDQKVEELKRMNRLMVDRELRMIEMKQDIAEAKRRKATTAPKPPPTP